MLYTTLDTWSAWMVEACWSRTGPSIYTISSPFHDPWSRFNVQGRAVDQRIRVSSLGEAYFIRVPPAKAVLVRAVSSHLHKVEE